MCLSVCISKSVSQPKALCACVMFLLSLVFLPFAWARLCFLCFVFCLLLSVVGLHGLLCYCSFCCSILFGNKLVRQRQTQL